MPHLSSLPTLPRTQRAWTFTTQGLPREILTLDTVFPVPPPPEGTNLLIRVTHVGLNPGCYTTLSEIPPFVRYVISKGKKIYVPEGEFSGIVHLAGPGAPKTYSPGTRVFGCLPVMGLLGGEGTLQEYFCVSAEYVALVPDGLSLVEASGLSGAGQTAWIMLQSSEIDVGKRRVFVNGGSGGVGCMTIQLAKMKGAYVVATCSERSRELVKSLGADEVVDYRANTPLHDYLARRYSSKPFDYIFDTIGIGDLFTYSPKYLKLQGAYINVGNFEGSTITVLRSIFNTYLRYYLPSFLGGVSRKYSMISTISSGKTKAELARMVQEGKLKVVVDEIVEFDDVLKAYDRMLARNAMGKIIIKVQDAE